MSHDLNKLPLDTLFAMLVDQHQLSALIDAAHHEDLGSTGDITTQLTVDAAQSATALLRPRADGRLAATALLPLIANRYDPKLKITCHARDGDAVTVGQTIAQITGPLRSILAAERVILNFICHLSGIASLTSRYVQAVANTKARIYDTRKTIPGYRGLAKYAVRCGGGFCHRIGLHDAVLIKDNHIAHIPGANLADRIRRVINDARALHSAPAFIEIEVDTLDQLRAVLDCGPDIVLLDNFTIDDLRQAVAMNRKGIQLEASGGITLDNVASIASTGIDRIAIGALTHSAPALDVGLDIDN